MHNQLRKQYTSFGIERQLVLPLNTEFLIPDDEPVRLLDQVLEELDYRELYLTYSAQGRNPSADPKALFKVFVYAYSQGITSSRGIEDACRYDVRYHYLLQSRKVPDHNTINRFRRDHLKDGILEDLFRQFIEGLMEMGEISLSEVFIDGTKIEANAGRYTFVWRKSVEKNYEKLKAKASAWLAEELSMDLPPEEISASSLDTVFRDVRKQAKMEGVTFVYGTGRRKTAIQRQYEALEEYTSRASIYEEALVIMGDGRNSYSKTDHDATFMHMKDDHMRNGQLKPGYNVQVATNSEYILGIHVSSDRTDFSTLIPFVEELLAMYRRPIHSLVCDAGYESEENYAYLKRHHIDPFIKPSNHEYSKTRAYQKEMEFRLSMEYDEEDDRYTCKNGKRLNYKATRVRTSRSGYQSETKVYECEDCSGCPYLGKCYKGKHNKQIQVSPLFDAYREESERNISSEEGVLLRVNRSIQAEGVFGITKQDMGFTRFRTRGIRMVRTEYLLLAFGFNMNKLHNRIQDDRFGKPLLIPKEKRKAA